MTYLPVLILTAVVIHVIEEFFYPGGFIEFSKRALTRFNRSELLKAVDNNMAITINSLFLLLCIINLLFSGSGTLLHYSLSALIMFNGFLHIAASIINKKYAPGLITSVLFYIPLGVYIFSTSDIPGNELTLAVVIGILLNAVPMLVVLVRAKFVLRHH